MRGEATTSTRLSCTSSHWSQPHLSLAPRPSRFCITLLSHPIPAPLTGDSDERAQHQDLAACLAPANAVLQLALIAAQIPESAALLAAQGSWEFLQSVSRWLMAPEGGVLAHPPEVVGGLGFDKQLTSVDFAGAYGAEGEQSPVHQLWCLTLSVQGARPNTLLFKREKRMWLVWCGK